MLTARLTLGLLTAASIASAPRPAFAQSPGGGVTLDSYRRARAVLMRGIDAMGGLDSLRALQDVTLELRGTRSLRNQSLRADPPYDAFPSTVSLVFDAKNGRLRWDEAGVGSVGFPFHNVVITDGKQRYAANLLDRELRTGGDAALSAHQGLLDRVPHVLLLDLLDRLPTLRWVGETTVTGGRRYQAIAGGAPNVGVRTFVFDATTGLLTKYETVVPDATAGDAAVEVVFADYRKVGPVMIPSRRTQRVAGEVVQDHRYTDVRVNTHPADSLFAKPTGLADVATSAAQPERIAQVAPGIWQLENAAPGYNMMIVEFNDHLLVVEAPNNSTVTERAIATIKRTLPGKPIRYVVPTHHHSDHAGGMRAFVAEGATIVTTPTNVGYYRRMAAATNTVRADALSRAPRTPVIETFTGRRVFTDGAHTVEFRDIGPSPHAQEMLIAYVPTAGIVFQGDLLNAGGDGTQLVAGNETTVHFAQWLDRSGLDVKTILGVHSPPRTRDELRRAVELMSAGR